MIIISTFKDEDGIVRLDCGYDTKTDRVITLPPEMLRCDPMGIYYDDKIGEYIAIDEEL